MAYMGDIKRINNKANNRAKCKLVVNLGKENKQFFLLFWLLFHNFGITLKENTAISAGGRGLKDHKNNIKEQRTAI